MNRDSSSHEYLSVCHCTALSILLTRRTDNNNVRLFVSPLPEKFILAAVKYDNKLQFRNQPQLQEVLDIMRKSPGHEELYHCVPIGKGVVGRYWWAALRTAMKTLVVKFRLPILHSSSSPSSPVSSSSTLRSGYGSPCLRSLHMNGVADVGRKIANLRFYNFWLVSAKDVHPYFSVVRGPNADGNFDADDMLVDSIGELPKDPISKEEFVRRKHIYCCEDLPAPKREHIGSRGDPLTPGDFLCAWCTASGLRACRERARRIIAWDNFDNCC